MAKVWRCLWVSFLAALLSLAALAKEAQPVTADPELEKRVIKIAAELRCLVCQNQTIADSSAGLAVDLRNQVRDMLKEGKSEPDIINYMTARYGEFVLYRPPVKRTTYVLWFGPILLLLAGGGILYRILRRRSQMPADAFEPDEMDSSDAIASEENAEYSNSSRA